MKKKILFYNIIKYIEIIIEIMPIRRKLFSEITEIAKKKYI